MEQLIGRFANMEKEFQADRGRAKQDLWIGADRDRKIEKEVSGLRDAVGGLNKEVEMLRQDLHLRAQKDADRKWESEGDERRVRVRWERTQSSPRGAGH